MAEDKFVRVDGLRLHYREFGDRGRPVLLFMHGLASNAYCFDHIAPHFAASHRVLALDFRGHGDSDWQEKGNYEFPDYVNDAIGFLAALGVSKASLIGSSLGGAVAMVVAAIKPELAERVVLNDIGPEINVPEPKPGEEPPPNHVVLEFRNVAEALECYKRSYPPVRNLADAIAIQLVRNSTRTRENGMLRWKTDARVQAMAPSSSRTRDSSAGMWPLFDAVKAPVLVIRGANSEALLPGTVVKMVSRRSGVSAVEVPGVGHTPWLSEPEALGALRQFLR